MKAVLFDLDGVITDTAGYHYVAWKNLASNIGIEIDEVFNEQLKGVSRVDSLDRILIHGGKIDAFTQAEKDALLTQKNAEYLDALQALTPADILPGIHDLLVILKKKNIKTSIASASKNAPFILKKLGISNLFDAIANPDSVANGKPAPDIFLKAAELVNVEPIDCVGVEDAISGIHAIKSAGMKCVAVGSETDMKAAGADVVVSDTSKIIDILF